MSVALLLAGVGGAVLRPLGMPAWALPSAAVLVDLVSGAASLHGAHGALHSLRTLGQPIGFLLAAVPLAVLLDRLGFFGAAAQLLTGGRHPIGWLWILAAGVTTVLNLDAGVVLLTPLYVNIARRRGLDPLTLALQPVILSWLASSALPVSNLTNLVAAASTGASTGAFVGHLGIPSLVAVVVGWLRYRRLVDPLRSAPETTGTPSLDDVPPAPVPLDPTQRRAVRTGGLVIAAVLVGFVFGPALGLAEWQVALAADVVLLVIVRRAPWRSVPAGTALVAATLAILASAAVVHLDIGALLGGPSALGLARTAGVTALLANTINNLPALLVVLPALGSRSGPSLWAALIGVNMGPVLLVTGTLASLLWLDTLGRLGVEATGRDVTKAGVRVGLPAGAAALAALLVLHAAGVAT